MKDDSVTISKAIAIILMVLAHSGFSKTGDAFINMFHMPLFFFMSGYCFKDFYLAEPQKWLGGKFRKLYWPYVKYSLLFLLLHNVFYAMHIYSKYYTFDDFLFRIPRIIIAMGMHDQLLGGYWFMGALFWGLIISYLFLKIFRNNAVYGIILSLVIAIIMNATGFVLHFINIQPHQFFAASFILAGVQYKRKNLKLEQRPFLIVPVGIVFISIGFFFWPGDVVDIAPWKIIPYFITAMGGTLLVFSISKIIVKHHKCQVLKQVGGGVL